MAKPTIVTRATKGSALTWTEGDANITNLKDATIAIKAGSAGTSVVSDLNGEITFVAGSNITLTGDNTAKTVTIAASGGGSTANFTFTTNTITSTGAISLVPDSAANVVIDGITWPATDGTNGQVLKTNGAGDLSFTTITPGISSVSQDTGPTLGGNLNTSGYNLYTTNNANISLEPNGTGKVKVNAINYNEGSIYDLGTTGGTIAPNVTNGNVQKITLNSALTLNAFTSPVAGQSLTLIIYGGTAYTSITSTMKFAGGVKTLTATAGCIDILTVYYDGTNYFASLGKGFA